MLGKPTVVLEQTLDSGVTNRLLPAVHAAVLQRFTKAGPFRRKKVRLAQSPTSGWQCSVAPRWSRQPRARCRCWSWAARRGARAVNHWSARPWPTGSKLAAAGSAVYRRGIAAPPDQYRRSTKPSRPAIASLACKPNRRAPGRSLTLGSACRACALRVARAGAATIAEAHRGRPPAYSSRSQAADVARPTRGTLVEARRGQLLRQLTTPRRKAGRAMQSLCVKGSRGAHADI